MRSRDRFLTTHTGSLPRPDDLIRIMYAKEEGNPVDPQALIQGVLELQNRVIRYQKLSKTHDPATAERLRASDRLAARDQIIGTDATFASNHFLDERAG